MTQQVGIRGDSWQETLEVAARVGRGEGVVWTPGAGGRLRPVLSGVVTDAEAAAWRDACAALGVELGEWIPGDFVRIFKKSGFQRLDADTYASLWGPEQALLGGDAEAVAHGRFDADPIALDDGLRAALGGHANLTWVGLPEKARDLASAWAKPHARLDAGALQVTFHHVSPIGVGLRETFAGPMPREANDTTPVRHVWGFFSPNGMESHFTVLLTEAELADNHQIAKKFRRLKQALNKIFVGPEWLGPEAVKKPSLEFTDLLKDEHFKLIPDVPVPLGVAPLALTSSAAGLPTRTHGPKRAEAAEARALQT